MEIFYWKYSSIIQYHDNHSLHSLHSFQLPHTSLLLQIHSTPISFAKKKSRPPINYRKTGTNTKETHFKRWVCVLQEAVCNLVRWGNEACWHALINHMYLWEEGRNGNLERETTMILGRWSWFWNLF